MKNVFSLVSPLYKTEKFLPAFLESVVTQDYTSWELLVVADGPSPEAKAIIEGYHDPRIRYIEKPWSGVCDTRNVGKRQAVGEFIAFPSTDFKLAPGCLRKWLMWFQDYPEMDFVYGAYGLMQDGKHVLDTVCEMFDPDELNQRNYIDGGFPIKRDKCPDWDTTVKSLNDWDFWIRAVKAGCKGIFMNYEGKPEITYWAEMPRKAGLSDDSHNNWIERTKFIKQKNGIGLSDVVVTSYGAWLHAKRVGQITGMDYLRNVPQKPHDYKKIYLLGYYAATNASSEHYRQEIERERAHLRTFHKPGTTELADAVKVIHWIGSDISLIAQKTMQEFLVMQKVFEKLDIVHLCECDWTQRELAEMGIHAAVLPLPVSSEIQVTTPPEQFTVGIYMPSGDRTTKQKYSIDLMTAMVRSCPDITFVTFGGKGAGTVGNEIALGFVPIQQAINMCSINVRLTPHDGLPITPIEFLLAEREVITSVPMAGAHHLDLNQEYSVVRESLIAMIRACQSSPRQASERARWRTHWAEETDPSKFTARFHAFTNASSASKSKETPCLTL